MRRIAELKSLDGGGHSQLSTGKRRPSGSAPVRLSTSECRGSFAQIASTPHGSQILQTFVVDSRGCHGNIHRTNYNIDHLYVIIVGLHDQDSKLITVRLFWR